MYLADALDHLLNMPNPTNILRSKTHEQLLWLLADFIYFWRSIISSGPDPKFVRIVSKMVSFLADEISSQIDVPQVPGTISSVAEPLPSFVRSEIATLVKQENVKGLLANLDVARSSNGNASGPSEDASALASYALTLLRVFPRRGDDIRMWLYQGTTSGQSDRVRSRLPAIKYFYQAASATLVFRAIIKEPRATIDLLKPERSHAVSSHLKSRDQQWRVVLLFLELYSFPLKLMDDEEFLSGSSDAEAWGSITRQSALPLHQVETLTVFLKNLTFSMYWNASEIAGIDDKDNRARFAAYLGRDLGSTRAEEDTLRTWSETAVAGVSGLTLEYVKRMVTGVLRMLYERE